MAQIRYQHVGKRFGAVQALEDLNLVVEDREFVTYPPRAIKEAIRYLPTM